MAVRDRDRFSTATRIRLLGEQTAARVYRSQTKRQARRSRLTGRAALLALVALLPGRGAGLPHKAVRLPARRDRRPAAAEGSRPPQRVEQLRDLKARWQDDAYAEQQIRLRLHYVHARGDRLHRGRPGRGQAGADRPGRGRPPLVREHLGRGRQGRRRRPLSPPRPTQRPIERQACKRPRRPPRAPSPPTRTSRPSSSSSGVPRAGCARSRTAARAGSRTSSRRPLACPTARPSRRCTT